MSKKKVTSINEAKSINPKLAQAILNQQLKQRVENCLSEIKLALDKYKCALEAEAIITSRGTVTRVQVVPLMENPSE